MMVKLIYTDTGVSALNTALQCTKWSNSANKDISELNNIPYEKLDDMEFDQIIEKMNEIRNLNTNSNLSDEERRMNAENAVLMLSKYLNLSDEDLD